MKKMLLTMTMLLLFLSAFGGSVLAMNDRNDAMSKKTLPAKSQLTIAQAVSMLVDGFDLNIDHIRFIKEPQGSDYFDHVADDAKYEMDFIIAHLNGLPLDKGVKPEAKITKELYADLLFRAMNTKGEFAFIEIFMMIEDEKDIDAERMNSIQKLLIADIAELDAEQKFHPKDPVHAGKARVMLHRAIRFVKDHADTLPPVNEPNVDADVEMITEAVNEEVNKVTVSWGTKPNPGYGIRIAKVEFDEASGGAAIYYELQYPDPGMSYIQMIVEPKAEVYVASKYKPSIVLLESSQSKSAGSSVSEPLKPRQ